MTFTRLAAQRSSSFKPAAAGSTGALSAEALPHTDRRGQGLLNGSVNLVWAGAFAAATAADEAVAVGRHLQSCFRAAPCGRVRGPQPRRLLHCVRPTGASAV